MKRVRTLPLSAFLLDISMRIGRSQNCQVVCAYDRCRWDNQMSRIYVYSICIVCTYLCSVEYTVWCEKRACVINMNLSHITFARAISFSIKIFVRFIFQFCHRFIYQIQILSYQQVHNIFNVHCIPTFHLYMDFNSIHFDRQRS